MVTRIDSENELVRFLYLLKESNVELPENLTLQINSEHLEKDILHSMLNIDCKVDLNFYKFEYMGVKCSIKKQ